MRPQTVLRVLFVVASIVCAGCTDYENPRTEAKPALPANDVPEASVKPPVQRQTPFCQAMIDLGGRIRLPPDDPHALTHDELVTALEDARADAPNEVHSELEVLVMTLRGEAVPTTLDEPADTDIGGDVGVERITSPSSEPLDRFSNYVDSACKASVNNPGPPPTEPGATSVPDS